MTTQINFSEVLELKNIIVKGYTTDFNQCDCCGRENLKGTITIIDTRYDVVLHYGTGCAAAADKYDTLDAVNVVKSEIKRVMREYNTEAKKAAKADLERRIAEAKAEYKNTPEKKAYDQNFIDREPLLEAAYNNYEEYSKIVEVTFQLGRVADRIKKEIMNRLNIPAVKSYLI